MCSTSVSCSNSELDSLHFIVCYNSNNYHVTVIHLFSTMESFYALLSVFLLSLLKGSERLIIIALYKNSQMSANPWREIAKIIGSTKKWKIMFASKKSTTTKNWHPRGWKKNVLWVYFFLWWLAPHIKHWGSTTRQLTPRKWSMNDGNGVSYLRRLCRNPDKDWLQTFKSVSLKDQRLI